MKGFRQALPALLCIAAFSFSATLWASSDLGTAEAERVYSAACAGCPLAVYPRHENGMPEITGDTIRGWERLNGVRCALPVSEAQLTVSGYGFSENIAALGAPQEKLAAAGIRLSAGSLPENVWQAEVLLGSAAKEKLAAAAAQTGFGLPGCLTLLPAGRETSAQGTDAAVTARISGVAAPTGDTMDGCVWVDPATLRAMAGTPPPIGRVYLYTDGPLRADELAAQLYAQGYLVANPAADAAATMREGKIMARQWAVLSALCFIASLLAAWVRLRSNIPFNALYSAAACAMGMLAAILLIQTATLLGWHFIIGSEARYILDLPRAASIFFLCGALSMIHRLLHGAPFQAYRRPPSS